MVEQQLPQTKNIIIYYSVRCDFSYLFPRLTTAPAQASAQQLWSVVTPRRRRFVRTAGRGGASHLDLWFRVCPLTRAHKRTGFFGFRARGTYGRSCGLLSVMVFICRQALSQLALADVGAYYYLLALFSKLIREAGLDLP